jgi:hypothetical protein
MPGARLPSNVPYLIDNLWEFARPLNRPSRRNAVYASPTPELALMNASAALDAVMRIWLAVSSFYSIRLCFSFPETDARKHPDLQNLQRVITQRLQRLGMLGMDTMMPLAALFLPGVTKAESRPAWTQVPCWRIWSTRPVRRALVGLSTGARW